MPDLVQNYTMDLLRDPISYSNDLWRSGLANLPPAIITCAITGANGGKEVNPNLPETLEEEITSGFNKMAQSIVISNIGTEIRKLGLKVLYLILTPCFTTAEYNNLNPHVIAY